MEYQKLYAMKFSSGCNTLTKICLFNDNDDNLCPLQEYSVSIPPSSPVHWSITFPSQVITTELGKALQISLLVGKSRQSKSPLVLCSRAKSATYY